MSYWEAEKLAVQKLKKIAPKLLSQPGQLDVLQVWDDLEEDDRFSCAVDDLPFGIEGRTFPNGLIELDEATFVLAARGCPHARFTVIHEVWHAWKHVDQLKEMLEHNGGLRLNRQSDIKPYENPEWQANALAAATLIPMPALKKVIEKRGRDIEAIKGIFGVSKPTAEFRLRNADGKNLWKVTH